MAAIETFDLKVEAVQSDGWLQRLMVPGIECAIITQRCQINGMITDLIPFLKTEDAKTKLAEMNESGQRGEVFVYSSNCYECIFRIFCGKEWTKK